MNQDSTINLDSLDRLSLQRPEVEFLLCCSRTHPHPLQLNRIQTLVQQPLDWNYLLERATYHSVLPLLDRQLQHLPTNRIPPEIVETIRSNCQENSRYNLRLTLELLKLSRLFETRSIPMLSFKGAVLAQLAYESLGLRQFFDIDILIPEVDVVRASHLLMERGYQPQFALTDKQQTVYNQLRNEHCFWHEEKQICVDLHWSILPRHYSFTPDPHLPWSKIDRVDFADRSVATLSPEHLLLFLCAHGSKHNWSRLYWICDLVELLRVNQNLDWEYIESLTGKFGTERMLLLGLYLADRLLGVNLPESIVDRFDLDPTLPVLATEIQASLFQSPDVNIIDRTENSLPSLHRDAIYRQTMTSRRDRLWYWIDTILTPTPLEWEIIDLPQWLFPLYYAIRSIRLTLKYLKVNYPPSRVIPL